MVDPLPNVELIRTDQTLQRGRKFDASKPRTDLLPTLPLLGVARVLGMGAAKYGNDNWRDGIEYRRLYGATLRHLFAWIEGEDLDKESGINHLYHALCELMFLAQFVEEGRTELDDRYKRKEVK